MQGITVKQLPLSAKITQITILMSIKKTS